MKQRAAEDYENLGRQMVSVIDGLSPDRKLLWRTNFIKGVLSGLGGVLGATIGLALLLWLLSLFGQVPLVGHFVDSVKHTLQIRTR